MAKKRTFDFQSHKVNRNQKGNFVRSINANSTIEPVIESFGNSVKISKVSTNSGITKRALVYNPFAKEVIRQNPGLLNSFFKIFSDKKLNRLVSEDGRHSFERVLFKRRIPSISKLLDFGIPTKEAFILGVSVNGEKRKFFIKRFDFKNSMNNNPYGEYFGTMMQKLFGLNVIEPRLAYVDFYNGSNGFYVSDFSNLVPLKKARKQKLISEKEYKLLLKKMLLIQDEINSKMPSLKLNISNKKLKLTDMLPRNTFFDPNTKQLYFFDPWLIKDDSYTRLMLYFQRLFMK